MEKSKGQIRHLVDFLEDLYSKTCGLFYPSDLPLKTLTELKILVDDSIREIIETGEDN